MGLGKVRMVSRSDGLEWKEVKKKSSQFSPVPNTSAKPLLTALGSKLISSFQEQVNDWRIVRAIPYTIRNH